MSTRIAVVTGAGQGIGRAIARKFADNGLGVVLVGRDNAKLERVVGEIGGDSSAASVDVTQPEPVSRFGKQLTDQLPHLDILVNCAGQALLTPISETSDADWNRMLAVNLTGPFLMTRALLPLLRKSGNGCIVNISSKVALKGYGSVTAYSAAKAGLVGFTRSLAAELQPEEIRVVALCPGPVDTPMRWAATPDFDRKTVISPETIAETVWHVVNLPKGVSTGEILIQSVHYD